MPYTTDSREYEIMLAGRKKKSIRILAEGDSWFAYPRRYIMFGHPSNVVQVLAEKKKYLIYSTASSSDEAVTMMSGEQKYSFTKRLKHTPFDLILFSGGGNDIVGKYDFDFFIKDRNSSVNLLECVDLERLDNKIDQIVSVYVELMERVEAYSSNAEAKVITHIYDYAIPDETGFELFDIFPMGESWMYPYLKVKNYSDPEERRQIVKFMLARFGERLVGLEHRFPGRLFVARTQGLLKDNQWRNEIHPTPKGFKVIAKEIEKKMTAALER